MHAAKKTKVRALKPHLEAIEFRYLDEAGFISVHLIGVYLIDVYLAGARLTGYIPLKPYTSLGIHVVGVHLIGVVQGWYGNS